VFRVTASPTTKYSTVLELQALSHQLEHMKVEFRACGFFVLNLPLFATLIGGIFTYILIMIQREWLKYSVPPRNTAADTVYPMRLKQYNM
jgi:hypothetical protein